MKKFTYLIFLALIIQTSLFSQGCLPEGITFTTQEEIDNFQINYPNCTAIEGGVTIGDDGGTNIINLDSLSVINLIGGSLWIYKNDNLANIDGLENLNSILGGVGIQYNPKLTNLNGLENLTSINGTLNIEKNDSLTDLSGLDNLNSIEGSLVIARNSALETLSSLENVTSVEDYILIERNHKLTNLAGFENLQTVGGTFSLFYCDGIISLEHLLNLTSIGGGLSIVECPSLTSLTGLESVTSILGAFEIRSNPGLTDLSALESVIYWSEGVYILIRNNEALVTLSGLNNISNIGQLEISDNFLLTDITAFNNVTSIDQYLWMENNDAMTSLAGLENLNFIGYGLVVKGNEKLTSLSGIDSVVNNSGLWQLVINDNSDLSDCSIKSICDFLNYYPNAVIDIDDNAPGCNNQLEVKEDCDEAGISDINFKPVVTVFPNPSIKEIFITAKDDIIINEVNIYNQIGQKVLNENQIFSFIDISKLKQGMYIIEVVTNELKIRDKLIIR